MLVFDASLCTSGAVMTLDATDRLLAKLNAGDADAAGQIFQTFEPYLRMVIRRQISGKLRPKFDSTDIVQSVWADVVDGLRQSKWTFANMDQLRAFLVKMTRNRFIDRLRQHRQRTSVRMDHVDPCRRRRSPQPIRPG